MKILITSPSIDPTQNVGGIANLTKLTIENNKEVDYDLFVAGRKDSDNRGIVWFFNQFLILIRFYKQIKSNKYNNIHINMPQEKMAIIRDFAFAFLCTLTKKKYIIHIRGGSYSKKYNIPKFYKFFIHKTLKNSTLVITLGEKEKEFINSFYSINKNKIHVLPNCVLIPKEIKKTINDNINICFLGRLDKNKGLIEIIDSLSSIKENFIFKVAGDGPERDWFLNICEERLKNKYTYLGVVSGKNKEKLLINSHIFLLPSYFEGLPNSLLEAMSYSNACIVTPVGSIPELIKHNENGLFVDVKNSKQISDSILRLVREEGLYDTITNNAYKTIAQKYSLDNYIVKLNNIYNNKYNKTL